MSRTLVGILETVALVAVQFVPGVGQAVGAVFGVSARIGTAIATLGVGLIEAGLNAVLYGGSGQALRPPETTETAVKSPTPPRVSAYGISRLYGAYILFDTDAQSCAEDVYAIHDGRMDGPDTFYIGDQAVASDRGVIAGTEDGSYGGGNVEIDYRLGLATETPYSQIVGRLPGTWSASHRGDGVVTAMVVWQPVKTDQYSKVYPNGQPPLSLAARWQRVFDWRDATQSVTDAETWKWSENAILHLAHYLLVRDSRDWSTHFLPTLAYWTAAADDCDVAMPIRGWQTYNTTTLQAGAASLIVDSANGLAPGMSITISAKALSGIPETRTVASVSGAVPGYGVTITLTAGFSYAHPSGSQVAWFGGNATEPRYRSCLAHKHTDDHKDVIAGLLACCDGWMSPRSDGALMVFSGRFTPPTVSLGPDEITSYSLQEGVDEENAINQITVTYVSQNHQFNVVDTDPWEDDGDIAARGKVLPQQLANQVPSHAQARRLAKRAMAKVMAPKRGSVTTNAVGRKVRGQRFINLDLTEAGVTFYRGPVEITKLARNIATGGVTFDWIMVDPNVDEWEADTEEGDPAPIGSRIAPQPLDPASIQSAVKNYAAINGDGSGIRIHIEGTGPDRDDLTWFARWRVQGAAVWNEDRYPDLAGGAAVAIDTGFVPALATVEVEITYEVSDGRVAPYSAGYLVDTHAPATLADAIADAATTAQWPKISDPAGTRPADNATNSADPSSPFGGTTVGAITGRVGDVETILGPGGPVETRFDDLQHQIDQAGGGTEDAVARAQILSLEASARGAGTSNPNLLANSQFTDTSGQNGAINGWTVGVGAWAIITGFDRGPFVQCGTANGYLYQDVPVYGGAPYSLSAEMDPDQAQGCYVKVDWLNSGGGIIGGTPYVYGDDWARAYTADNGLTAPNNATKARVYCVTANTNGNGRFTRVQFQRGAVPSAYRDDGDAFYTASRLTQEAVARTNEAGTYAQQFSDQASQFAGAKDSWLKGQIKSTQDTVATNTKALSQRIDIVSASIGSINAPNLLGNGSFANGLGGWVPFGGASWAVITQYTPIFAQSTNSGYSGMYSDVSGIVAGKNYCFGFECDHDGGENYAYLSVQWFDSGGNQLRQDNGTGVGPGSGWGNRRNNGPFVAPSGATLARVIIYLYGSGSGNRRVARVQFQQSDQPTGYSDAASTQALQAQITQTATALADVTTNRLAAYFNVTAQAGNNMAGITIYASNGQGGLASGVILGGNVQIQGNLLVTGSVDAPQLAGSAVQAVGYTILQTSIAC